MSRKRRAPSDPGRTGRVARGELEQTEEAFLRVREDLLESIAESAPLQMAERERAYMALFVLGRVREALLAAASNAPLEEYQAELDKLNAGTDQPT